MKSKYILAPFFESGDFVRTYEGVGIVLQDDIIVDTFKEYQYGELEIQHKFGYSNNPSNSPVLMDRDAIFLIDKKEYDEEKDYIV